MTKEIELLGLLQEECAEVIQIASKIRRFGEESKNPYDPSGHTNRTLLEHELGDVRLIVQLLERREYVSEQNINKRVSWKHDKLVENGIIPKPPSFKEWFSRPVDPEVAAAWEEMDKMLQADRKRERILSEISMATEKAPEEGSSERKYLLTKAAQILLELESLPDED